MGVFKNWQGRRRLIHLSIIQLIVWLGWLSNIALAQMEIGETLTGSVNNFPSVGIACIGNLAVFVTSLLRGRLDLEMGARDVLATMRGPTLHEINNGFGLTTCDNKDKDKKYDEASVVMLSLKTPNLSIRQFMKYVSNAYNVHSIILQCFPVKSPVLHEKIVVGEHKEHSANCKCIVFSTVEEVAILLALQIPGILKRLSDSLYLLPSKACLEKGCHGCKQGLLYVETDESGNNTLIGRDSPWLDDKVLEGKPLAVVNTLDNSFREGEYNCICIPLLPSGYDYWTKLLSRSFRVRDTEDAVENFSTASLIVPRLAEVVVNIALTFWFRVDGFSSSLVARRSIRDYVVDTKGSGFAANAFLTKAESKVESHTKYVCHVLTFRGSVDIRTFSFMVGSVNLICSISWVMLMALNESKIGKWFDSQPPLSEGRVAAIIVVIGIIFFMDGLHLLQSWRGSSRSSEKFLSRDTGAVFAVLLLETICMVLSIVAMVRVLRELDVNAWGKVLTSVLQVLVWVKWAVGSYLLGEYPPEYDSDFDYDNGILVYSSAFLLNSVLAGIRRDRWSYTTSIQKDN